MSSNVIKIIGIAASIVGAGATIVSSWVQDKKLDETVATKVSEALANKK